ncbi:thiol reductant ABC exporter subunit CydC [Conexibacter sp. CPCC 206217]|uniref:thiol reductant ABC exporter subunit CydC n=1 Tax=Conexibacter sp. CPCC 206217 TaxID=3064574 RepID=UPI002728D4A0|nr:thiol reductant ABC exporter subunit CydC [Conexibacter sp. CPCC 206217]MDO8213581.1 thiol reductant ABC exporter subunit CydC [Conexibacter sp. CPCC 206217]
MSALTQLGGSASAARGRFAPLIAIVRLAPPGRGRLAASIALGAGAVLSGIALLATSGYLISRAAEHPPVLTLMVAIVAVRFFGISRALLRYYERVVSHDLAFRVLADLRRKTFARLAPLVPGDIGGLGAGDLLSRFVADVDTLQHLYLRALAPPAVALVVVLAASGAAVALVPLAGVALFVALLLAATVAPFVTARAAAGAGRRQAAARAELTAELLEAIEGGAELAVAGRADERRARLRAADARLARLARGDAAASAIAVALGGLLAALGVVGVLAIGIPAVHDGRLDGVLLAALVLLALASFEGVAPLGEAARRLHACAEAAARIDAITTPAPSVADPADPIPLPPTGDLVVERVTLRYGREAAARGERERAEPAHAPCGACALAGGCGEGAAQASTAILRNASLRLVPGERVVLTGASGAGKTTLVRLLARLHDPDAGSVTLGGVDLRAAAQADVRAQVLAIAQDARIFTTTLRENVLLARRDASDAEIVEALTDAGLGDWLATLPDGLATVLGEDGALVSGGERQRVLLARALLSDARFLVLDEPTSHLDPATARAVMRDIDRAAGDRGVLIVTHDPAVVARADRTLELRGGRVV